MLPEDRLCFFLADMDFRCASEITDAIKKVAAHGVFGYSSAPAEYLEAVCRWMRVRFGLTVKPEEIRCYSGARAAITAAIDKLTNPGDGVIVPLPTFRYRNDVNSVGRYYVGFQMKNDNGYYTFDWEVFERLCREPQNTMVTMRCFRE